MEGHSRSTYMQQQAAHDQGWQLLEHVKRLKKRNAWGDQVAISGIAAYLRRNVCLWTGPGLVRFCTPFCSQDNSQRDIHICVQKQHVSTLHSKCAAHHFRIIATIATLISDL